jgi:hypothetical protein
VNGITAADLAAQFDRGGVPVYEPEAGGCIITFG